MITYFFSPFMKKVTLIEKKVVKLFKSGELERPVWRKLELCRIETFDKSAHPGFLLAEKRSIFDSFAPKLRTGGGG
jgi:hypothetical protein